MGRHKRGIALEELFQLKKNGTNVKTEIIAGLTSFMTMAYIIALNPNLLVGFDASGTPHWNGVFMGTCIASAIGMFVMAFAANKPFGTASGMGMNSFFAVVVANIVAITGMSYLESYQAALVIVLIEGTIFVTLSLLGIREKIIVAIPTGVRLGIPPAMGIMLMNIGFGSNAGVNSGDGNTYYMMQDYFGALTTQQISRKMGDSFPLMLLTVVTAFLGLFIIVILAQRGEKAAMMIGMLAASLFYWAGELLFLGTNPFAELKGKSFLPPVSDWAKTTLFKFNFKGFVEIGFFTIVTLIVTFCVIDMFNTIGSLVGAAGRVGMVDRNGKMPKMREALLADAVGTVMGSVTGTSPVTTFIESASGVEAGGRTGLTALTTGIMFLACMFIAPLAAIIPAAATSSALIYVGILMLGGLKSIDFNDICQTVPVGLMMIAMPISGSVGHGIGLGLISYSLLMLFTGKGKKVSVLTYILSLVFFIKFFLVV